MVMPMGGRRISARAAAVAALALASTLLVPAQGTGSAAYSYSRMLMDDWITAKTFLVTAEAIHAENGDPPVGLLAPPAQASSTRFTGHVEVCVTAVSYVEERRVRRSIREKACPSSLAGYRYDAGTFEASIVGVARTQLWTRIWKVIGNRWTLVTDRTVRSTAKVDVTWRWSDTPRWSGEECGGLTSFATGLAGPATVRGSIRFRGARLTATIPAGKTGYLFVGGCAAPV
jgi:hypothetical protein